MLAEGSYTPDNLIQHRYPANTSAHVLGQLLSCYGKQAPHLTVCWSSSIASRTATKGIGIGRHRTDQTSRQACVNQHIISCGQILKGHLATTVWVCQCKIHTHRTSNRAAHVHQVCRADQLDRYGPYGRLTRSPKVLHMLHFSASKVHSTQGWGSNPYQAIPLTLLEKKVIHRCIQIMLSIHVLLQPARVACRTTCPHTITNAKAQPPLHKGQQSASTTHLPIQCTQR